MPTLISPEGIPFRTEVPSEIVRLRSRGYRAEGEPVTTVHDEQFHPAGRKVEDVLAYIEANPADANRVIAEEKAGQARVTIIGKPDGDE